MAEFLFITVAFDNCGEKQMGQCGQKVSLDFPVIYHLLCYIYSLARSCSPLVLSAAAASLPSSLPCCELHVHDYPAFFNYILCISLHIFLHASVYIHLLEEPHIFSDDLLTVPFKALFQVIFPWDCQLQKSSSLSGLWHKYVCLQPLILISLQVSLWSGWGWARWWICFASCVSFFWKTTWMSYWWHCGSF